MFDLKNKVALVTGGRRGMGKADAFALAQQGAAVAVTDIDEKECQLVADAIVKKCGKAIALKLDVASKKDIDKAFNTVILKFGRLDILVNNAGIFSPKPALEMTEADWDRTLDINLKGQFFCAQRAAQEMSKNKWGRIINIASIASGGVGIGFPGAAHYTASKGGIIGMTETLADEWARLGITVNAIAPGAIDTSMVREPGADFVKGIEAMLKAQVPLARMGKPEDIAAAVVFLASEEANYVTGSTIYVDGGWMAA